MKIEPAMRNDVPELLELQYKAFAPVARKLQFAAIPQMTATIDDAYAHFDSHTTLKKVSDGRIVGSVSGKKDGGSLYIGRLMVSPDCQRQGIGRKLLHHLESMFPCTREWLCSYRDDDVTCGFYSSEGFRKYDDYLVSEGLWAIHMEKIM
ncbi:MAG: GNAT family N-acetyltransferase [Salinivirgaceae bacterium]|nr:GNAT family N-acetyltransferase [Salinivirgaceae bacterium]